MAMRLSLIEAARSANVERVVVHSLDRCVYTASVLVAGDECILVDDSGRSLRARNLVDIRRSLAPLSHLPAILRQSCAYDEMVGQAVRGASNVLEIPIVLGGVEGDILS